MARKARELDEVPPGLVEEVEAAVRASGAVPLRKLATVRLSRRAEGMLHEALARRGLERTGKALRVPVREQVAALIAGGPLPLAAVRKGVRGLASAGELKLVVADLVRTRRAAIVMRGAVEHLAAPSASILSPGELGALRDLAKALGKLATSVRPRAGAPARSLWRPDVAALLDQAGAAIGARPAEPGDGAAAGEGSPRDGVAGGGVRDREAVDRVVEAVRRCASGVTGLAAVPAVVRALGAEMEGDEVREALLAAAASGRLELRPESGVGLLAPADAALCPTGPDGWPLSWARAIVGGG